MVVWPGHRHLAVQHIPVSDLCDEYQQIAALEAKLSKKCPAGSGGYARENVKT
jgi:hypothetical protein